jgi:outer membrane immunogenic protein
MCLRRSRLLPALCVLCALAASGARAQDAIGGARVVERDVAGSLGDVHRRVSTGDDVFQDEVITTSVASLAQLELVDLTSLSIGPSAQVKLDRFVFDRGKKTMVIAVARGAFRFVSASGDHKNYMVKTPTATIGVRGTRFDVLATTGRTDVFLHQGAIDLCNAAASRCRRMSPGHGATVTPTRLTPPQPATPETWTFETTLQAAGLSASALSSSPAPAPQALAAGPRDSGGAGPGAGGMNMTRMTASAQPPSTPGPGAVGGGGRGLGGDVGGGPRNQIGGGSRGAAGGPSNGNSGGRDVNGGISH